MDPELERTYLDLSGLLERWPEGFSREKADLEWALGQIAYMLAGLLTGDRITPCTDADVKAYFDGLLSKDPRWERFQEPLRSCVDAMMKNPLPAWVYTDALMKIPLPTSRIS